MKRFLSFRWVYTFGISMAMGLIHWRDGFPWNIVWIVLPLVLGLIMEGIICYKKQKK